MGTIFAWWEMFRWVLFWNADPRLVSTWRRRSHCCSIIVSMEIGGGVGIIGLCFYYANQVKAEVRHILSQGHLIEYFAGFMEIPSRATSVGCRDSRICIPYLETCISLWRLFVVSRYLTLEIFLLKMLFSLSESKHFFQKTSTSSELSTSCTSAMQSHLHCKQDRALHLEIQKMMIKQQASTSQSKLRCWSLAVSQLAVDVFRVVDRIAKREW
jgi:hypothetical protein